MNRALRKIISVFFAVLIFSAVPQVSAKGFFPFEDSGTADVPTDERESETPYDSAIAVVKGLGYMSGNSDTVFGINDSVTYAQLGEIIYKISAHEYGFKDENALITYEGTAEVFLDAMGYTPIIRGDIISYASSAGLFKKLSPKRGETLTKAQLAQTVYNALNMDICEQTGFGDKKSYEISVGKTLLSELKIKEIDGFVNANSYINFYSSVLCESNEIQIDRKAYKYDDTNVPSLIGNHVTAYIDTTDENNEKIVFIMKNTGKNQPVALSFNASEKLSAVSSGIKFKNKTYKLSADVHVSADFKYIGKFSDKTLSSVIKKRGEAGLYDSDNDGKYDIIFIKNITDYAVKQFVTINDDKYVVTDKSGKENLNIEYSENKRVNVLSEGKTADIASIKIGDTLSVCQGEGITEIVISKAYAEGEIVSFTSDSRVTLSDEKTYVLCPETEITGSWSGKTYKFYLTYDGLIAYIEEQADSDEYFGYLVGAKAKDEFLDEADFKIFTSSGEFEIFAGSAKMLFIDGNNAVFDVKQTGKMLTPKEVAEHSSVKNKALAVKYKLNDKGEIMKLVTPSDNSQTGLIDTQNFSLDFKGEIRRYNDYYSSRFRSLGKNVLLGVPTDVTDEDEFSIPSLGFDQRVEVEIYDAHESGALSNSLIVCRVNRKTSVAGNSANIGIVKERKIAYVNDDAMNAIEIYKASGAETSIYIDSGSDSKINASNYEPYKTISPQDLKPGDVIQYNTDSKSVMTAFRLLCRTSDNTYFEYVHETGSTDINNLSYITQGYGRVMAVDVFEKGVGMSVNCRADQDPKWNRALTVNSVLCFDSSTNTAHAMPREEITKGDNVFYFHSWGYEAKTVIVVR